MIVNGVVELAGRAPQPRARAVAARRHFDSHMRARGWSSASMQWAAPDGRTTRASTSASHVETVTLPLRGRRHVARLPRAHAVSTLTPSRQATLAASRSSIGPARAPRCSIASTTRSATASRCSPAAVALRRGVGAFHAPASAVQAVAPSGGGASALARALALLPPDPPTPLKAELGTGKRVAWSDRSSLDEVEGIARVGSATLNDVLVRRPSGCAASAPLRAWRASPGSTVRAMLPVNLRHDRPRHGQPLRPRRPHAPVARGRRRGRLATVKRRIGSPQVDARGGGGASRCS